MEIVDITIQKIIKSKYKVIYSYNDTRSCTYYRLVKIKLSSRVRKCKNKIKGKYLIGEMKRSTNLREGKRVQDKSFTHKVCACVALGVNLLSAKSMRRNGGKI